MAYVGILILRNNSQTCRLWICVINLISFHWVTNVLLAFEVCLIVYKIQYDTYTHMVLLKSNEKFCYTNDKIYRFFFGCRNKILLNLIFYNYSMMNRKSFCQFWSELGNNLFIWEAEKEDCVEEILQLWFTLLKDVLVYVITAGEARTNSSVMYSYGPPHMAKQKLDDQLKHTYSSYVRIWDVTLKIFQKRRMLGRSGERGSGISVLAARHDDIYVNFIYASELFL